MKKKIVYITGSRADFGRAYYILKSIQEHPNFELHILVTSMHLSPEFGYTLQEVEEEFQISEKVDMLVSSDTGTGMAKSFGLGVIGISQALQRITPDLVILLGDRGEMLAGAIASKHLNIPVAHIGGGYISGSIDDRIRDAITVFSDIHFVASRRCFERVISIGADHSKTHIVGAPDLEIIRKKDFLKPQEVIWKFSIESTKPLILVSYHPVTEEYEKADIQMKIICESIMEFKTTQVIITYPNADAGGRKIITVLEKYSNYPFIQIYKHIPYKSYLGLMNLARVMIGNSSAGLIEAASFGLPLVDIGIRQKDRERAENVVDVKCTRKEIIKGIKLALHDKGFIEKAKTCQNLYGDGRTSDYVMKILKNTLLGNKK